MRPDIDTETDPDNWKCTTPPLHVMWKQLEDLVKAGKIRSIGVSNCTIPLLLDLLSYAEIKPAVNQVELHPYHAQPKFHAFHEKFGVKVQCYASIGAGGVTEKRVEELRQVNAMTDKVIVDIAARLDCTPAQVILAWHLHRGLIPLVKTATPARLPENIHAVQIKLTEEDMTAINGMDKGWRFFNPSTWAHWSPLGFFPFFE
jgi:diketogulonate reductase-like aldo/keto reductase